MSNKKEQDQYEQTVKQRRARVAGFALTVAGLSAIFGGGIGIFGALVVAGLAWGTYKLVRTMSEGLDLTTHNRQDKPKEFEEIEQSGNEQADDVIAKGKAALEQIRAANDAIKDPTLTRKMYELEDKCTQIFRTVAEKPDQAFQIRKFMNYYLPTTLKMLESYRIMQDRGISEYEMSRHRATLNRGLDMVVTACQKQLDNLYKDTMLDISTDIDVLEQMLKRDGFTEGDLSENAILQSQSDALTAAAAQLGANEVPQLVVPGSAQSASGTAAQHKTNLAK